MRKTNLIRKRQSYLFFENWYKFLINKPTIKEILVKIYHILDSKSTFGSQTNANAAYESLI